jgi:hypothetical protein
MMRNRNTFNIISTGRGSHANPVKTTRFHACRAARQSSAQSRWGESRAPCESAVRGYAVRVIRLVRFTRSFGRTAGNAHHTRRCG